MTTWPGARIKALDEFGLRWYGIQFNPGEHIRAVKELTQRGFVCSCPMMRRVFMRRGARVVMDFPLFTPYMFVQMDVGLPGWRAVMRAPGLGNLFPIRNEFPVPAEKGAVEELMARYFAGEFNEEISVREYKGPTLEHGDAVRVCNGPFTSFDGLVDLSEEGRFKVLVSIFGRTTPARMEPSDVEFVGRAPQAPASRVSA